jgi:hypothetical protein
MSKRNKAFIQTVGEIIAIQFLLMILALSISIPYTFGQTAQPTTVQGANSGNLEFKEQDAYIVTELPDDVLAQNSNMGTGNELTNMIAAVVGSTTVTGILNGLYTKMKGDKSDRKTDALAEKDKSLAIENEKRADVQYSQSKQFYEANPTYANNLNGTAPETKLVKLQENKEQASKVTAEVGNTKPTTPPAKT